MLEKWMDIDSHYYLVATGLENKTCGMARKLPESHVCIIKFSYFSSSAWPLSFDIHCFRKDTHFISTPFKCRYVKEVALEDKLNNNRPPGALGTNPFPDLYAEYGLMLCSEHSKLEVWPMISEFSIVIELFPARCLYEENMHLPIYEFEWNVHAT